MLRPGLTRFLLAFLVILFHLSQSIFLGKFAVGCFFILSGYWISLMFEKKYSLKKQSLKVYYISRAWRLFPVFYSFTIIALIVYALGNSTYFDRLGHLEIYEKVKIVFANIFILGYALTKSNILVPAWSLDIEIQFYILFPLLVYILGKNKKRILLVTLLFFVLALLIFIFDLTKLNLTSMSYIYLFMIGMIIYHYKIHSTIKVEKWSLGILAGIIAVQYMIPSLKPLYRDTGSQYYSILSFILTIAAIPTLINSIHKPTNEKDKFLGEMSFMIYLSHWIWLNLYNLLIAESSKMARIPYIFGFLFMTFLSAYLVYKFIDRPSEKLRHKWVKLQP